MELSVPPRPAAPAGGHEPSHEAWATLCTLRRTPLPHERRRRLLERELGREPACALYAPLAEASRLVLAQVGQSLDGRVATVSGDARDISGAAGLRHLHRCRALVDAIVIGVGTVVADDPSLTVRLVHGANPVRVIVDPHGRIPATARLLHDGAAPTLLIHGDHIPAPDIGGRCLALPANAHGHIAPQAILDALAQRGLHRVLVEGGARTIAAFLEADCIDRLHVAVAPLIIGAGPSGIALPPVQRLAQARRPLTVAYDLGGDVVFDCDLRNAATDAVAES